MQNLDVVTVEFDAIAGARIDVVVATLVIVVIIVIVVAMAA